MSKFRISVVLVSCILTACASSQKKDQYADLQVEQLYKKGVLATKKSRFEDAVKDFEALEARFPYGEYTCKAQMALIYAHYKDEDYASALAAADRFIRLYPYHKNIDYVYYLKGIIYYNENYDGPFQYFPIDKSLRDMTVAGKAFDAFKILLQQFPKSKYITDAKLRMIHLRNQMAAHELNVAQTYLKKKAYIAACNRAGFVLYQFGQSDAVPKALAVMFIAYRALGLESLAADTLKIFQKNFPGQLMEHLSKDLG